MNLDQICNFQKNFTPELRAFTVKIKKVFIVKNRPHDSNCIIYSFHFTWNLHILYEISSFILKLFLFINIS